MTEDISNKTVAVLLVLTITISLVGTIMVFEEAQKVKMTTSQTIQSGFQPQPDSQVDLVRIDIQKTETEFQGGLN